MRKFWSFIALLVILFPILVACGGGEEATATSPPAPEEKPTEAPEPTKEPVAEFVCEDEFGCVTVNAGEKLRIATALVISGPNETLGIDAQRGVEIAIDDRQNVLGFEIELVAEDGQCNAEGGQTAATKITSDETIVAVVGHNCSSSCTPAAPIYEQAGFTMISPSCTAPALTGEGTHVPSFLRTCHNDKVQGSAAARFFYEELGIRTAATIHDGSPYAEQLQQVFADTFSELGGTITAQEAVNVGDTDMRPLLTSIAVDQPELLYYPIFVAEGGFITVQAKEIAGLEGTILAGADGMISPDFVEAAGDAGEGMYITGPNLDFSANPLGVAFEENHLAKYGEPPISAFHAHGWDAAMIIFDAVEKVGVLDKDGNLHVGRKALREAIYGTTDFAGVTGTLTCDEFGDCADPSITVNQIQGGEYVGIWNDKTGYVGEATAPAEPAEVKTMVIGFTASRTGKLEVSAGRQAKGLELWKNQVNEAGGITLSDGTAVKFSFATYDDESSKDRVQELYTRLATEDNADLLISPYSSGLAAAASVIAEQYGKVMITTGAAADSNYQQGYTQVFQIYTPASRYLTGAIDMLKLLDPNVTKLAIVHEDETFSTGVVEAAKEYAESLGYEIMIFEGYASDTTDFGPFINKIEATGAEAILGGGHLTDGSTFARQVYEKGVDVKFFTLLVAPPEPDFAELGEAAYAVVGPSQWEPLAAYTPESADEAGLVWYGPLSDDFVTAYEAAYDEEPSYHSAGGYAAGVILQKAIEDANSTDPAAIKAALDNMDVLTFFGYIKFDTTVEAHGLQIGHSMVYIQWQKDDAGNLMKQVVWPQAGATAETIYPIP